MAIYSGSRINIAANAWTGLDNILIDDVSAEPHFSESVEGIRFKYKNTETMLKAKVEDDKLVLYKPDNALFREGFIKGITYNIDLSDSSLSGYHFAFSTTSDGGYNGTEAVDADEVALSETTLMVNIPQGSNINELYYYAKNHSGMGGLITILTETYQPKIHQAIYWPQTQFTNSQI